MKICGLEINNFKSIRHLKIENIDNAFILVGKNSTGKTAVLDAIRLAAGMYEVRPENFSEDGKNIEIKMSIQIDDDDMVLLHERGIVSKYRNFDSWLRDFKNKLPSFNNGILDFTFIMNREKGGRYCDGIKKNNKYIKQVIPKIYFVDNERNISEYQHAILMKQADADLYKLLDDKCMFDNSKNCTRCFECIGMINDKPANELTAIQTAKVLEYKLFNQNIDRFAEQVNKNVAKNGLPAQYVKYVADCDFDKYFKLKTYLCNKDRGTYTDVETMSAGTKSIYLLSLLEAYIDDQGGIPCIIMIEDPESYLHPSLQKAASEVLFRLSKKNQVIFSTHSPNMIFNFAGRQINQVVLDEECYTVINEETDIDEILDDLGYTANDLMNVSFVFIVEGKQDSQRLPLLLEKYYSEIYDENGMLKRISIITTNSCTNIKTYANLKYINKLYIKDQFLMIRDSDGKNPKYLVKQLCGYYAQRNNEDVDKLPRVTPKNVLVLSYYSFENYFLDPVIMAKIGVVKSEEEFYNILWQKYRDYLYKLPSMKRMCRSKNVRINNKNDLKKNMENIKTYVRGHNLYDIFYGRYRNDSEREILKRYIDVAPREAFADILDAIDGFVYFENRKKSEDDIRYEMKGKQ